MQRLTGRLAAAASLALLAVSAAASVSVDTAEAASVDTAEADAAAADEVIRVLGVRTGRLEPPPTSFSTRIDIADFEAEGKTLEDLLADQEGVQLRRFGGAGEPSELSIRGSTASQVVVLLDGVPLNSALTGGVDLSEVCLGLVDAIEVSRGGGAVQQGSGAIGGVVQLTTRAAGEDLTRASLYGGSFDTWRGSLFRSAHTGPLDYSLGYCGMTTAGDYRFRRPTSDAGTVTVYAPPVIERINNERVRHAGTLGLGFDLGPRSRLELRDHLSYASHGEPGLDSGNGTTGGQNPVAHGRDVHNVTRLAWSAEDLGRIGSQLDASLFHRFQRDQYRDPIGSLDGLVESTTEVSTLGFSGGDTWQGELLAARHRLSLRLEASRDSLAASERPDRARNRAGVMLQEEARLFDQGLLVVPALRLDWSEGFGETWLPSLGLVLSPWPWLRVRGNVQRSYRVPGFDELYLPDQGTQRGNPDLLPERARNLDAGADLLLAELGPFREMRLSAGCFQQDIDESVVWMQISPETVAPRNTGAARVRGYELALSFTLTAWLRFEANHTALAAEQLATGQPLPGRAERETFARIELGPPARWKLVAELQSTGTIPVSPAGGRLLPERNVWNASAALNIAGFPWSGLASVQKLWLVAELHNLADAAVRDSLVAPQPGRSGSLGLEAQW